MVSNEPPISPPKKKFFEGVKRASTVHRSFKPVYGRTSSSGFYSSVRTSEVCTLDLCTLVLYFKYSCTQISCTAVFFCIVFIFKAKASTMFYVFFFLKHVLNILGRVGDNISL